MIFRSVLPSTPLSSFTKSKPLCQIYALMSYIYTCRGLYDGIGFLVVSEHGHGHGLDGRRHAYVFPELGVQMRFDLENAKRHHGAARCRVPGYPWSMAGECAQGKRMGYPCCVRSQQPHCSMRSSLGCNRIVWFKSVRLRVFFFASVALCNCTPAPPPP